MTKKNQDFEMFAGNSKDIIITMADSSGLSGATIKWVLKKSVNGQLITMKTVGGGISIGLTFFTVRLNPADTEGLSGRFYHEAELTDVLGNVSTVTTGHVTIEASGV